MYMFLRISHIFLIIISRVKHDNRELPAVNKLFNRIFFDICKLTSFSSIFIDKYLLIENYTFSVYKQNPCYIFIQKFRKISMQSWCKVSRKADSKLCKKKYFSNLEGAIWMQSCIKTHKYLFAKICATINALLWRHENFPNTLLRI